MNMCVCDTCNFRIKYKVANISVWSTSRSATGKSKSGL